MARVEDLYPEVRPLQQRPHRHAAKGERRRHRRRRLLGVPRQVVQVRQSPSVAGVEADHPVVQYMDQIEWSNQKYKL